MKWGHWLTAPDYDPMMDEDELGDLIDELDAHFGQRFHRDMRPERSGFRETVDD